MFPGGMDFAEAQGRKGEKPSRDFGCSAGQEKIEEDKNGSESSNTQRRAGTTRGFKTNGGGGVGGGRREKSGRIEPKMETSGVAGKPVLTLSGRGG